jgi:hypothetical protein
MCARKETDVRESANDCTLAGGEGHGSCGETCYAIFDENSVFPFVVRTVFVTKETDILCVLHCKWRFTVFLKFDC